MKDLLKLTAMVLVLGADMCSPEPWEMTDKQTEDVLLHNSDDFFLVIETLDEDSLWQEVHVIWNNDGIEVPLVVLNTMDEYSNHTVVYNTD